MPPYSGAKFQVLLRAHPPDALVELTTVTAREWESSIAEYLPSYPSHSILGRIRHSDVELFDDYPSLWNELLSLGFTIRRYDRSKCMSVYADTEVKDRTLVQKLQDQLYEALKGDGENIGYGLVAATPANMMLVVKLDRQRYNPENPCAETITTIETTYNTIGYILDNDVFITSPKDQVKRFCLSRAPWVIYKILDKTIATEYARYQQEQKEEKVRQHKMEKRKAKKIAAASAEKGTEQERQGVLEANGKDTRKGGKSYKKPQDGETTTNGQTGAGNETQRLEKKIKIGLHNLTINEAKHRILQQTSSIENDKLEVKGKRESRIAEIKKPGWFFSGEDVLKDG